MLLVVTGASGAGKSTALRHLEQVSWPQPVRCVDFDSVGVPARPDTSWRHRVTEHWVQQAIAAQNAGEHMLLCGQVPPGELLAVPSADQLSGLAVCALHCSPEVRTRRLLARGEDPSSIVHHNRFGEWFRAHCLDPTHMPEVIRVQSDVPMAWERWAGWRQGDPRWDATIIDTDHRSPTDVAEAAEAWARGILARGTPAGG